MTDLKQAAQAVVDRWDTPAWEWGEKGPTADLIAALRKALGQQAEPVMINRLTEAETNATASVVGLTKQAEPVALEVVYETIINWDEGGGKRSRRELAKRIVDFYTAPPRQAITALRTAQQQQAEPVAWRYRITNPSMDWVSVWSFHDTDVRPAVPIGTSWEVQPLYTTPPQQQAEPGQWIELTDEKGRPMTYWGGKALQQAEPVATMKMLHTYGDTTPPQRKPLSDEEIRDLWSWSMTREAEFTATTQQHAFARAIEAAHGIKEAYGD